jgi:hypothetical protein
MIKRFKLRRVGAGPGCAVFECDQLLGAEVEVVDAEEYDALAADVLALDARIVELEEELEMERNDDRGVL